MKLIYKMMILNDYGELEQVVLNKNITKVVSDSANRPVFVDSLGHYMVAKKWQFNEGKIQVFDMDYLKGSRYLTEVGSLSGSL